MKNLKNDDKIIIDEYSLNYLFSKSSNNNIKLIFEKIGKLLFSLLNIFIIFFINKSILTYSNYNKK
jgi:hypothetical protein